MFAGLVHASFATTAIAAAGGGRAFKPACIANADRSAWAWVFYKPLHI